MHLEEHNAQTSEDREALTRRRVALDNEAGQMSLHILREEQRLTQVWATVMQSEQRNASESATLRSLYQECQALPAIMPASPRSTSPAPTMSRA
eukprot:2116161-Lingulodinium_polyedra.AAC.1